MDKKRTSFIHFFRIIISLVIIRGKKIRVRNFDQKNEVQCNEYKAD
jgi:hypothetical protein